MKPAAQDIAFNMVSIISSCFIRCPHFMVNFQGAELTGLLT